MMAGLRSPLLMVVSLLAGAHLGADEAPLLGAGARIRFTTAATAPSERQTVTGTLVAYDAESLTVTSAAFRGQTVIPRSSIAALEVRQGKRRSKGALIGGAIGLGVGMGLVASGARGIGCNSSECLCGGGGCGPLYMLVGGTGAAIGAGIGALAAPARWESMPPGRLGRTLPMDPPMIALSDHVSFGMTADRKQFRLSCRLGL